MIDYNVEDMVRKYVNFRHGVAGEGWNVVYCEVCGDGSRTKGPRGGWIFSDGGESCFYHCFNCGCKENFSTQREHFFSKGMRNVFDSFGVPSNEYNGLLLKKTNSSKQKAEKKKYDHKIIEIPDYFALVKDLDAETAKPYKTFLKTEYGLTTKHYSFYYGTGKTIYKDKVISSEAKRYKGRLIIPYFKNGKMIYFQARDITNQSQLKYLSPDIPKNNILFNFDQLYRNTNEPLYVVEGAPDAIHLNGVSTLGNELSTPQKEFLTSCKRRKILVPDFKGDSNKLAEEFIDNGWEVSFPNYRTKFKDVSEAIVNYGKLYVAHDIVSHIKSPVEAKIMLSFMNKR